MSKIILTDEGATPATPSAGTTVIYTQAGVLYTLTSSGSPVAPLSPSIFTATGQMLYASAPGTAAALAIGTAAYRDTAWISATRIGLREQAAALDTVLARRGFRAMGACPLFRLIEVDDAAALFERLAKAAILTRPFDYDPRWLRLGLPAGGEGLDRLDRALAEHGGADG